MSLELAIAVAACIGAALCILVIFYFGGRIP